MRHVHINSITHTDPVTHTTRITQHMLYLDASLLPHTAVRHMRRTMVQLYTLRAGRMHTLYFLLLQQATAERQWHENGLGPTPGRAALCALAASTAAEAPLAWRLGSLKTFDVYAFSLSPSPPPPIVHGRRLLACVHMSSSIAQRPSAMSSHCAPSARYAALQSHGAAAV